MTSEAQVARVNDLETTRAAAVTLRWEDGDDSTYRTAIAAMETDRVAAVQGVNAIGLSAPTGLVATGGVGDVDLVWVDVSGEELFYEVDWSADGASGWTTLTSTLVPGSQAYTDTPVTQAETRFYRVRALGPTSSSGYSNIDSGTAT
jgi:hypothetical protein